MSNFNLEGAPLSEQNLSEQNLSDLRNPYNSKNTNVENLLNSLSQHKSPTKINSKLSDEQASSLLSNRENMRDSYNSNDNVGDILHSLSQQKDIELSDESFSNYKLSTDDTPIPVDLNTEFIDSELKGSPVYNSTSNILNTIKNIKNIDNNNLDNIDHTDHKGNDLRPQFSEINSVPEWKVKNNIDILLNNINDHNLAFFAPLNKLETDKLSNDTLLNEQNKSKPNDSNDINYMNLTELFDNLTNIFINFNVDYNKIKENIKLKHFKTDSYKDKLLLNINTFYEYLNKNNNILYVGIIMIIFAILLYILI